MFADRDLLISMCATKSYQIFSETDLAVLRRQIFIDLTVTFNTLDVISGVVFSIRESTKRKRDAIPIEKPYREQSACYNLQYLRRY